MSTTHWKKWKTDQQLTINYTKTKFMILTQKKYVNHVFKIKTGQNALDQVSKTKYLAKYKSQ